MLPTAQFQRICVIGLGYIGLPTASLLATKGFAVTGVDVSASVVDTINRGEIHIVEPDLGSSSSPPSTPATSPPA